jgi:hypothetical protein
MDTEREQRPPAGAAGAERAIGEVRPRACNLNKPPRPGGYPAANGSHLASEPADACDLAATQ